MTKAAENSVKKDVFSTIECSCGKKIMLLPDLKAMGDAIEKHAVEHKDEIADQEKAESEADHIRDLLTMQVLMKAAESIKIRI